jgi:heme d1 biosynthesis radical SAM protein NirJ
MQTLVHPQPVGPARQPPGPVVIWNLIRRCNLTCKHCYSISADIDFPGELSTPEIYSVMDDLKAFKVPVLILSGGEPLLHPDIYDIAKRAKSMGFYVGLSSNGTLIDASNIKQIAAVNFDYVGVSIDGIRATHDTFRQKKGSFDASMDGIALCQDHGIKAGIRFTLTQDNSHELEELLELSAERDIDKFYLSHLNYAGRGHRHRKQDVFHQTTRKALDLLFDRSWRELHQGIEREYVTGNNDADGPYMLQWAEKFVPDQVDALKQRLINWGGNSSGQNVANIDNQGNVHPDTFWWDYHLGNVKSRPFSKIWSEPNDELMTGLRMKPRPVHGRCGDCQYLNICGGNTRVRAYKLTGDFWAEDPACYLDNEEIGLPSDYGFDRIPLANT